AEPVQVEAYAPALTVAAVAVSTPTPLARLETPAPVPLTPADEVDGNLTADRRAVRQAIRPAGHAPDISSLAAALGLSYDATAQLLHRMAAAGDLVKEGRGQYALPSTPGAAAA